MGLKKVYFDLKLGQDLAREGDSHIKVTGMLVVSLWVVNCRFRSHLHVWDGKLLFLPIQVWQRNLQKMP